MVCAKYWIGGERIYKFRLIQRHYYSRLRDEATLVITSRLHCAVPCIAMGIPVILVKNSFDERFSWVDKYIPFYTPDKYKDIDWSPTILNIEDQKQMILRMAIDMLHGVNDKKTTAEVHNYYMNRKRQKIKTPFRLKCYNWLVQKFPELAIFIREKVLFFFTIKS